MKKYLKMNVYEAAMDRLAYIFNNFERIYISFSGGKDSGVLLNLALDYMRKNATTKKIGCLFIDLEGQYKFTIEYVQKMFRENADLLDPYWCCLPLNLRNAVSVFQPFWTPWDEALRSKWIRGLPDFPVLTEKNNPFPFFKKHMEFEEFTPLFGKWYSQGHSTACLVGIRSDESLNRWRTIASKEKETYEHAKWTTKISESLYNAYPIYDWTTEDIWTANARFGWHYNELYDFFYMAGVALSKQRICQPYGDDQRIGLNLFRVIEPETWHKVVARVNGANFGNIYSGEKCLGYGGAQLPPGHTWKSYTKLLLKSLPPSLRDHYMARFKKFLHHWRRTGSAIRNENFDRLPAFARKTGKISTRGHKDKMLITYKRVADCLDRKAESDRLAPTWRRMANCIIKNDHLCKSLSFTQTKEQRRKISETLEKYRNM